MCQMCEVEPLRYGEILPDWFLERLIEFKKTAAVEYPSKETNND